MQHKIYLTKGEQHPTYKDEQLLPIFWGDTWLGFIILSDDLKKVYDFSQNDHITLNVNDISFISAWCLGYETGALTLPTEYAPDPEDDTTLTKCPRCEKPWTICKCGT